MLPAIVHIGTTHFVILGLLLFIIGAIGVLTRRNAITVLMSIELMFNAANINLVAFSHQLASLVGQVFTVFVITVAAGEAAIGLAIIITLFRHRRTVNIDEASMMKW
ncbi:NADH-quinone oxidoreductase subunit NuoK [Acidobacteriota bacterium]